MKRHHFNDRPAIIELVSEYEAMSQKGAVGFYEEKVFFQLIDYYHHRLQIDRALEVIDHALSQHSFSANFHIRKAQLLIETRQEDLAIDSLEQAQIYAPSEIEIFLLRVEILCSLGKHEEALVILESIKTQASREDLNEIYMLEAQICEYRHQFEEMYYVLEKILTADPSNKEALERMWLCVELSQKYRESIRLHLSLIDEDPYSYMAWFNLGHAYHAVRKLENAAEAYEYAYIINDQFQDAYRDCAFVLYELGAYKKALSCYEEALEHFQADSDILLNIGKCYQAMDDINIARAFYIKSIGMNPLNDESHYYLAECYSNDEEWKIAIQSYKKAIKIDNRREEYYSGLGEAYFQLGKEDKANHALLRAIEVAPDQISTWVQYAVFLMELESFDQAIELIDDAALNISNNAPELVYCRIACLFSMGRRQEALYRLGDALTLSFHHHDLLFHLTPELQEDMEIYSLIERYRLH